MTTCPILSNAELARRIKRSAADLGFDAVGIAPARIGLGAERLSAWLAAGKHGEMTYMARHEEARHDPNHVLPGVRSIVMTAHCYRTEEPAAIEPEFGRVSCYAWGDDYHDVLRQRLGWLGQRIGDLDPTIQWRAVVDSAPLMERDYAQLAGLGWIGKNTLLLNRRLGSWFFLGGLLVDRELDYDQPTETDHCGTCTRCLDACPTSAFDGPYQLDPRRCISYLTIEHRSAIPEHLRELLGDWLFGCDVCQDVCPWNAKSPISAEPAFAPRPEASPIALRWLLGLDDESFRRVFRGTPLFRSKRTRVLRNAAIVAANQRLRELLPELRQLLLDPNSVLSETAAWAIERIESNPIAGAETP